MAASAMSSSLVSPLAALMLLLLAAPSYTQITGTGPCPCGFDYDPMFLGFSCRACRVKPTPSPSPTLSPPRTPSPAPKPTPSPGSPCPPTPLGFTFYPNQDVSDTMRTMSSTSAVADLARSCLFSSRCVGFNTKGELKRSAEPRTAMAQKDQGNCKGVYVHAARASGSRSATVEVLLSHNHAAYQSSTYSFGTGYGKRAATASRAVDGFTVQRPRQAPYCSSTNAEKEAWWVLDLGSSKTVTKLDIYQRTDCCTEQRKDIEIRVGDDAPSGALPPSRTSNAVCTYLADDKGDQATVQCDQPVTGRYVSLHHRTSQVPLTLCEVEVHGYDQTTGTSEEMEAVEFKRMSKDDVAYGLPAGYRLVACEEAETMVGSLLKLLAFDDVCKLSGGALHGTRYDGKPANGAYCDSKGSRASTMDGGFGCAIITNLPKSADTSADAATKDDDLSWATPATAASSDSNGTMKFGGRFLRVDSAGDWPKGWRLATCAEAQPLASETPVGFNDVCEVADGDVRGPRTDNLPGQEVSCGAKRGSGSRGGKPNCYILTDLPDKAVSA